MSAERTAGEGVACQLSDAPFFFLPLSPRAMLTGPSSSVPRRLVLGCGGRLHPLYGRCFTNAHLIRDTGEAGIFPLAAMANHSCRPNAG